MYVCMYVRICVCMCVNFEEWGRMFQVFPVTQTFDIVTQSFDTRKTFYL